MEKIQAFSQSPLVFHLLYAGLLLWCTAAAQDLPLPSSGPSAYSGTAADTITEAPQVTELAVPQPCKETGCIYTCRDFGCNAICAVRTDGRVRCWGKDAADLVAVPEEFSSGVAFMTMGGNCACAVSTNGSWGCWGAGYGGDCATDFRYPDYEELDEVDEGLISVSISGGCACAVTTSGLLVCDLIRPDGSAGLRDYPQGFTNNLVSVSCGDNFACALHVNGSVACWGGDTNENLITIPNGFTTDIASVVTGSDFTCAINNRNNMACWGFFVYIPPGWEYNISSVSTGYTTICAVKTNGTARCWGLLVDSCDYCNIGAFAHTLPADFNSDIAVLSHAGHVGCAVKRISSQVACWGDNMEVPDDVRFLKGVVCSPYCVEDKCRSELQCEGECMEGFIKADNNTCLSCSLVYGDECLTCNRSSCVSCVAGYFTANDGTCAACSEGCAVCFNVTHCSSCLPGFQKKFDTQGRECEVASWCPEDSYPFSCNGLGCTKPVRLTMGRTEGCMRKRDCVLNYQHCLHDQPECRDCCLQIQDKYNKTWFLMRFSDNTLMTCDPPWVRTNPRPQPCRRP